jgi:ribosome-associated toxin RatA of RatAB toxin-antitoxin module
VGPIQLPTQWILSYFSQTVKLQERVAVISVNFHDNEREIIKSRWKIKENNNNIHVDLIV